MILGPIIHFIKVSFDTVLYLWVAFCFCHFSSFYAFLICQAEFFLLERHPERHQERHLERHPELHPGQIRKSVCRLDKFLASHVSC